MAIRPFECFFWPRDVLKLSGTNRRYSSLSKRMSEASRIQRQLSVLSPAEALSTDDDSDYLPWQIAFRVTFPNEKIGLRFHPAHVPDTGNGIYTLRLLELTKGLDGSGPAQQYNKHLQPGQEHLTLRPGLYLTHINDRHLDATPCEEIIQSLQTSPRPVTLRFVDVEAGVVTHHELQDSLRFDRATFSSPLSIAPPSPLRNSRTKLTDEYIYKIILLGTAGVGKSSILAVATNGDTAYMNRRSPTLEAEFGTIEFSIPSDHTKTQVLKARLWDTAGQERYRAITRSHYRRADGALLVYDVSDAATFERLGEWLHTLRETAGDTLIAAMVLENKVDKLPVPLNPDRPKGYVHPDQVPAFCKAQNLLFARTTAKCNTRANEWDGGVPIVDAVKQLVLEMHQIRTNSGNSSSTQEKENVDKSKEVVEIIDKKAVEKIEPEPIVLVSSTDIAMKTKCIGDCGGCEGN